MASMGPRSFDRGDGSGSGGQQDGQERFNGAAVL